MIDVSFSYLVTIIKMMARGESFNCRVMMLKTRADRYSSYRLMMVSFRITMIDEK